MHLAILNSKFIFKKIKKIISWAVSWLFRDLIL
jgi:hypothetical protein